MRITAGVLIIIGGFVGGFLLYEFVGFLVSYFAGTLAPLSETEAIAITNFLGIFIALVRVVPVFLAAIGGIYALMRKRYKLAFVGAIFSLLFPVFGVPALILLVKSKGEFLS